MRRSVFKKAVLSAIFCRQTSAFQITRGFPSRLSSSPSRLNFANSSGSAQYIIQSPVGYIRKSGIKSELYSRDGATSSSTTHTTTAPLSLSLSHEEIEASLGPDRKVATKPFVWSELQHIVNEGDPTMHSRSMQVQHDYILHTREVKAQWRSINDYILYSKFDFERIRNEESGLYESSPSLEAMKEMMKEGERIETRLLLNEYPYYVADGIEHWCLWKLGGMVTKDEISEAANELNRNRNKKMDDVLTWVNPPHLQSIPDIDHAHLLCLFHDE